MTPEDQTRMRLQYAGAIGLLAQLAPQVDDETRDLIEQACRDWAAMTQWHVSRSHHHIGLFAPKAPA